MRYFFSPSTIETRIRPSFLLLSGFSKKKYLGIGKIGRVFSSAIYNTASIFRRITTKKIFTNTRYYAFWGATYGAMVGTTFGGIFIKCPKYYEEILGCNIDKVFGSDFVFRKVSWIDVNDLSNTEFSFMVIKVMSYVPFAMICFGSGAFIGGVIGGVCGFVNGCKMKKNDVEKKNSLCSIEVIKPRKAKKRD